jgi:hypothetical protein
MVEFHGREHGIASAGPAQLVFARRHAVDRDEKPTAFGHPLRNRVRQLFADGQIHVADPSADLRTRANAKRRGAQSSARRFTCNSHSGAHGVTRPTNAQSWLNASRPHRGVTTPPLVPHSLADGGSLNREIDGCPSCRSLRLSAVAHPPDCTVAVFADEEAAIFGDCDSNGATPNLAVGCDETGYEIFVLAARFAG